jgi:hypothetical protein
MANTYTQTNIAPRELIKPFIQHFYYDFAPTDSIMISLLRSLFSAMKTKYTNWFNSFIELTEEEIKIVEGE